MKLIKSINDERMEQLSEATIGTDINRLISRYKKQVDKGTADRDKIRDDVGNDLEMLEYSPEEVQDVLGRIMKKIFNDTTG